jgi:hypothetical protein
MTEKSAGQDERGERQVLSICPRCGCRDLFVRKDFPQKIGLTVVIASACAFLILATQPRTFMAGVWVLVVATAFDALLYLFVGRVTVCYRCRAEFRDLPVNPSHTGFELAVAEKYRAVDTSNQPSKNETSP